MNRRNLVASLSAIPEPLRTPLMNQFEEALAAYEVGDWEKVGVKAVDFVWDHNGTIFEYSLESSTPMARTRGQVWQVACRSGVSSSL